MTQTLRGRRPGPAGDADDADAHAARRSARRVTAVVLLVGVVVVGTWVVAFSPVLGAKRVLVRGAHVLSAAQVRAAAAIRHGAPLARLDTGAVAGRVDALPDVAVGARAGELPVDRRHHDHRARRGRLPRCRRFGDPRRQERCTVPHGLRDAPRAAALRPSERRASSGCRPGRRDCRRRTDAGAAREAQVHQGGPARSRSRCCSRTAAPCAGGVPIAAPTRRACFRRCSRVRVPRSTSAIRTSSSRDDIGRS